MSFKDAGFATRFKSMGDQAEAAFDLVYPKHHKIGLNRPDFSMAGMPATMRYTPDRMTRWGFTEVMGIGNDQTLKIKDEKLEALDIWQLIGPVFLFVFDSTNVRYWTGPLPEWMRRLEWHSTEGVFHEGKTYRALRSEHFPVDPTALDAAND